MLHVHYRLAPLRARGLHGIAHPGLVLLLKWTKIIRAGGQPHLIPIAAMPGHQLCPLAAYQRMLEVAPTRHVNDPLLTAPGASTPVTTGKLRQSLASMIQALGLFSRHYTLHSLRRGGASLAYQSGVDFMHIKRHGTWKSDAFWAYITPSSAVHSPLPGLLAASAAASQ